MHGRIFLTYGMRSLFGTILFYYLKKKFSSVSIILVLDRSGVKCQFIKRLRKVTSCTRHVGLYVRHTWHLFNLSYGDKSVLDFIWLI